MINQNSHLVFNIVFFIYITKNVVISFQVGTIMAIYYIGLVNGVVVINLTNDHSYYILLLFD